MTINKQKGFTLVELLIVISILAVLTTIGIISFSGAQRQARDAQRKNDLRVVQVALGEYFQDNASLYPDSATFSALMTVLTTGTQPYMRTAVQDPRSVTSGYQYVHTDRISYVLRACLENPNDAQGASLETGTYTIEQCPSNRMLEFRNP
jgi:prepilin-type N-terminal cleavage/methylation domain-containing protein